MQAAVALVDAPTRAAAMLKPPLRLRILERVREPDSATGVAAALGLPRQRIGYHMRELENNGLVRHVADRRKGNCIERLMQSTARQYVVSPSALGAIGIDPESVRDRFSSDYLIAVAAQTMQDVADLQGRAREVDKKLPTFTLQTEVRFLSPDEQHEYVEELSNFIARLTRKHHDARKEGGRVFRFAVTGYPAPSAAAREGGQGGQGGHNPGGARNHG